MLSLRKLLPSDLDRVLEIEALAFSDPWPRQAFEDVLDWGYALQKDDLVVGYVFALTVLDECSIANIAIDPLYQKQGLGEYLMTELIFELFMMRGVRLYYLEVRPSNAPARRLYEKLGFKELGLRKAYYHNPPEDALTMGLSVPDELLESLAAKAGMKLVWEEKTVNK